ncbi:MAG: ATP-binding protein [Cyanobacteriota bacterium]
MPTLHGVINKSLDAMTESGTNNTETEQQYQEHLEELLAERTDELRHTLERLQQEITDRKQAEETLRLREEQLRAILDKVPSVIYLKDFQGRHIRVNSHRDTVSHLTKEQVLGKTDDELFRKAIAETFQANDQAVLAGRIPLKSKRTEEELRQSEARFRELAQREALLNRLASQIRRSLDLNTILETAVHEIRNLLQIDRCFFLWYRPDHVPPCWEVIQEAKTATFPSLIGHCIPVITFGPLTARVFNKEITRVDSARTLSDPAERKFFFSIGYTALLALPIHTTYGEIGVVSCGHSSGSRPWRDSEVELLRAVADQIAIAIDQAHLLHQSRTAEKAAQEQASKLELALRELQQTQVQLIQSEKMSSLGQLVAGVAHEINNPVSFIYGNLSYVNQYVEDLLNLVQCYQESCPQPTATIQALTEEIDLDFIREDLPKILNSMKMGADRISQIVLSLRNFSRADEAEKKWVDIHEGLNNTLLILDHRLKAKQLDDPGIQVIKDYGNLPKVQCYPGQLNQVFMNILSNAIEAIDEYNKERSLEDIKNRPSTIWICTEVLAECNQVVILIGDNGPGMTSDVCNRLFEPFFTTKPVGSGTGLGMSISYQIVVEKHQGQVQCISAPGHGAAFLIYVPIHQSKRLPSQEAYSSLNRLETQSG